MKSIKNLSLNKVKKRSTDSRVWKSPLFYKIYLPLFFVIFYLPIISLILFSFNSSNSLVNFKGFSFKWYTRLFRSTQIMEALYTSLSVAAIATFVAVIVGTLGAIGLSYISKKNKKLRNSLLFLNNIPVVSPEIVTAIALMVLFMGVGIGLGYVSMLLAHISFCIPYVIIAVYPKVVKMDKALVEASLDLGCSRGKSIFKVMIPELLPSIISGGLMAFTMSFDDFVISYFVGGSNMNISTYLYSLKKTNPAVNALTTIIIIIIGAVLILSQVFQNIQKKKGLQSKDAVGTPVVNNNLERKLVPNGSKEAIEMNKDEDILSDIDNLMRGE